jgi:PAS domain S-box-containing protein
MFTPYEKPTILVVDDSPIIRSMTSHVIEELGYHPLAVPDGESCIDMIGKHRIDLLLLDINLPDLNGIEILSYLEQHNFTFPVIMISGSDDLEQVVRCIKLGAYEYLMKPIDNDRLEITVKNALSESGLKQKLNLFSEAITQSPLSVVITDDKGIIEYTNPAFSRITGYEESEAIGRNVNFLKYEDFPHKDLWQALSTGNVWQGEFRNRKKNGELYWERALISPITDHARKISHFIALNQDISELKKQQEAYAESEKRFQELTDLLPQPVFEINIEGNFTYCNRSALDTFGYSREDLMNGVHMLALFVPDEHERILRNTQKKIAGENFDNHEYLGRRKDGSVFHMLIYSESIIRDNTAAGIRGIVIDITERKLAEEKLRILNKTLEQRVLERTKELEKTYRQMMLQEKLASIGQLAAGIAHELNNPINFLRINCSTLEDDITRLRKILQDSRLCMSLTNNGTDAGEFGNTITGNEQALIIDTIMNDFPDIFAESKRGFERIAKIIGSMRSFSYRHSMNDRIPFNINKGIQETLIIAKNEYFFVADINTEPGNIPDIICNPEQIKQVFLNLVVNSSQAIASQNRTEKGRIMIRSWFDDTDVHCMISDDGPGIPDSIQKKIFEPFFTTKGPGKGTGLGLSISYDIIVQRHGGNLTVYCPEGGGTAFTVSLPLISKT